MRKEFTVASSNSIHGRAQQLWQMSWNLEVGDNHIFVDKAFDNKPYRAGGFVTIEYGVKYMWAGDKSGAYIYGRYWYSCSSYLGHKQHSVSSKINE